jgi:tetratricopeptide (TPR) repeat protein
LRNSETSRATSNTVARLVLAILPFALAFLLYLPSLANPLIWDDTVHIPRMQARNVAVAFEREPGGFRRPLVLLSYWAQSRLGLDDAYALHAANVALHGANAVLLFSLLTRLNVPLIAAASAAALWVAHPLQWAAVAYVSGRTDLLAAFFVLLALHVALSLARAGAPGVGSSRDGSEGDGLSVGAVAFLVVSVACAALAKETGLLAGPLAAALYWTEARAADRGGVKRRRTGALIAGLVVETLVLAVLVAPTGLGQSVALPLDVRLRAAGAAAATYARLLVVPVALHLDRFTAVDGARDLVLGCMAAAALVATLLAFAVKPTRARFAAFALALLWLPASNLFPIHPAIATDWVFTGEHLVYLPLAALVSLAAVGSFALGSRVVSSRPAVEGVVGIASAALVVAWSAPLVAAERAMSDEEAVYRRTLEHSPSPRACFNLGVSLLGRGEAAEAVSVYERCAEISPNDAGVYAQLGVAYQRARDRNKAEIAYAKALALDPLSPYAWSNYASLEASAGFYDSAREKWQRALAIEPGFAPALDGLAKLKLAEESARDLRPPS